MIDQDLLNEQIYDQTRADEFTRQRAKILDAKKIQRPIPIEQAMAGDSYG